MPEPKRSLRVPAAVTGLDAIVWEADAATGRCPFVSRDAEEILGHPAAKQTTPAERSAILQSPRGVTRGMRAVMIRTLVLAVALCYLGLPAVSGAAGGSSPQAEAPSLAPADNPPAQPERWIDVDRTRAQVRLMEGDRATAVFPAAVSADLSDDGWWATAIGEYRVYEKEEPLHFTPYGEVYISHWVGFDPERLNGFHSMPMDSGGKPADERLGAVSLGCVRLRLKDAEQVFDFARVGMRVVVHW